ncbi:hypothetical protein BC833DRAFT_590373 [Globomyces pollinis-pini]|nr:hypothetical protein BC833DRAFT_590373 [Globomyces pollinis-pini]
MNQQTNEGFPNPPPYSLIANNERINPPPYNSEVVSDKKLKNKLPGDESFIVHYITNTDTLVGISLRYNITIQKLRQVNRLFTDEVCNRESLIIPGIHYQHQIPMNPDDELKKLIKRFQIQTKCVDYFEAKSYMMQNDYDLDMAVVQYCDDLEWESKYHQSTSKSQRKRGLF